MHVHVYSSDGEAKFWLHPKIELAVSYGMPKRQLGEALQLISEHEDEIRDAWNAHFGN